MRSFLAVAALATGLVAGTVKADVSIETSALQYPEGATNETGLLATMDGFVDDVVESLDDAVGGMATLSFWKNLVLATRKWSGGVFILLMCWMLLLTYLDSRHPRKAPPDTPVSVVLPCYNDAASVQTAIASVFKACPGDVDLIVMGSRGLGIVKGVLLGSVSQYIVEQAKCPVLVVK